MSKLGKLTKIIESFRRLQHDNCPDDPWFSCPMHPEYSGLQNRSSCLCYMDEHNAQVDEALRIVQGLKA
jgi:hypothetical protein